MGQTILVVDDDPNIREVIGYALETSGFGPRFAEDGLQALERARRDEPALVVLDIGLPEMDGLEVCRELRKSSDVPILFLTARDDEIDKVIGLEIGGDDYVTKPFSPRELVARIKVILKRARVAASVELPPALRRGVLEVTPDRHLCRVAERDVALTPSEFTLLAALMSRPDHVLSRQQLIDALYGHNIHISARTVDSHIRNLRAKLVTAGCNDSVVTVHGVGLRMGACQGL